MNVINKRAPPLANFDSYLHCIIVFVNVGISEAPKERPRLQLKPRSDRTASSEEKETSAKSSIFGAAKPVDTAKKEAEIDQKLQVVIQYLAIGLFSCSGGSFMT